MHILHVVGARPNFMKAAPVLRSLASFSDVRQTLVHTGQHYDASMSDIFFEQLGMPKPDANLEVGSASHSRQTAEIMMRFEIVVLDRKPELVLVYGDVNSTVAAALVCAKLRIPLGHVEAGLRSRDRAMPEEINRLITDQLADLLFTPSRDGDENLLREGIAPEKIHLVGNVMIDTLVRLLPTAEERWPALRTKLKLPLTQRLALVTLHRPSNVDDPETLKRIMDALKQVAKRVAVVFPVHPRTRQRIAALGCEEVSDSFHCIEPLGYLDFLALQTRASVVISDSGGVQEETTFLGIPCLTLRENTERPITVEQGTNKLLGQNVSGLSQEVERILRDGTGTPRKPELWDGQASERIARVIRSQASRWRPGSLSTHG